MLYNMLMEKAILKPSDFIFLKLADTFKSQAINKGLDLLQDKLPEVPASLLEEIRSIPDSILEAIENKLSLTAPEIESEQIVPELPKKASENLPQKDDDASALETQMNSLADEAKRIKDTYKKDLTLSPFSSRGFQSFYMDGNYEDMSAPFVIVPPTFTP